MCTIHTHIERERYSMYIYIYSKKRGTAFYIRQRASAERGEFVSLSRLSGNRADVDGTPMPFPICFIFFSLSTLPFLYIFCRVLHIYTHTQCSSLCWHYRLQTSFFFGSLSLCIFTKSAHDFNPLWLPRPRDSSRSSQKETTR